MRRVVLLAVGAAATYAAVKLVRRRRADDPLAELDAYAPAGSEGSEASGAADGEASPSMTDAAESRDGGDKPPEPDAES